MTYRPHSDPSRTYDDFRLLVKTFVQSKDTARKELATYFEVGQSTVDRWWMNLATPPPLLVKQITDWIKMHVL